MSEQYDTTGLQAPDSSMEVINEIFTSADKLRVLATLEQMLIFSSKGGQYILQLNVPNLQPLVLALPAQAVNEALDRYANKVAEELEQRGVQTANYLASVASLAKQRG